MTDAAPTFSNILEAIGNTPMVRLVRVTEGVDVASVMATILDAIVSTDGQIYRVDGARQIEVRAQYSTDDLTNNLDATEALVNDRWKTLRSRFSGEPNYFADRGEQDGLLMETNFVADAINLPLMVYWSALGEALGLAMAEGVDPTQLAIYAIGLIAILFALYQDATPDDILKLDPQSVFTEFGLAEHLTQQRSNGLASMVARIRADATAAAA